MLGMGAVGYLHGQNGLGSPGGTILSSLVFAVNLGGGVGGTNYNFAELGFSSLAGFVYLDANNNGVKDPGESGIANVTITLSGTNDHGPVSPTTTTPPHGRYQFRSLPPGLHPLPNTDTPPHIHP